MAERTTVAAMGNMTPPLNRFNAVSLVYLKRFRYKPRDGHASRRRRCGRRDPMTTLRDVAAAAEVSVGTASNVFSRPELVSDDARGRVEAAARKLGYSGPDPAARRLRTGIAGAVG